MKYISFICFLFFLSCVNKEAKVKPSTAIILPKNVTHVTEKYPVGDINNDQKSDTATVSYNFNNDTNELFCSSPGYPVNIHFGGAVPDLNIDQSQGLFVKEAFDLNADKTDDILLFSRTYEGNWDNIFAYALVKGTWTELARTKIYFSEDNDADYRIVKEEDQFYLVGDSWDDAKGGLVPRNLKVKITDKNAPLNWLDTFDLDGDGKNEHVYFDYTNGGHCCYIINIALTSDSQTRKFPFKIDGGYISGVDNSQPQHFNILDIDNDGLPEIIMEIETYNGNANPIPASRKKQYGITTNKIVLEYVNKEIRPRDL